MSKNCLQTAYKHHIKELQARYEQWMSANDCTAVVIDSGVAQNFYQDDIQQPYRAAPHFKHWMASAVLPGAVIVVRQGLRPAILFTEEKGFWHQPVSLADCLAKECFDWIAQDVITPEALLQKESAAYVGADKNRALSWQLTMVNPPSLLDYLNWYRAFKSDYEQQCLKQAAQIAWVGHQAVAQGFEQGLSEWQLHLEYLRATEQSEQQLPYPNIIALNNHAAILHYQHRERSVPSHYLSLLIDAGADFQGYGADISRTYAAEPGLFADLLAAVTIAQQKLIQSLRVGQSYVEAHEHACLSMARVLHENGVVLLTPEEQLASGVLQHFFPHGVGHLLGIQTHDVGGHQLSVNGGKFPAPAEHPFLRLTRTIETDMVFTIEPGLYFIDSLLSLLKEHPLADSVDWNMVDALRPYGGIRIEDNVVMKVAGAVQLSR